MTSTRPRLRRTAAGIVAGTLAFAGVAAAAPPASAATGFGFDRLAGVDRYETSAAVAARFSATAGPAITDVILAGGESGRTPDALAASFLAGVRNAPVLVTRRDTTPASIRTALEALRSQGATRLTIVGGPVAVSEEQVTSLRSLGFTTVERRGGADRFETARMIVAAGESPAASNVGLVASGISTIDALAGGPLAYKGKHPVLLVTRDGVPTATLAAIRAAGVTSVYVLGGEAVVGPRVVAQLAAAGVSVTGRLAGADRSETSVRVAEALVSTFGFTSTTFNVASGANEGIDALSGAALSGRENRPLLITNTSSSAPPVVAYAARNNATLNTIGHIFGGATVVTAALEAQIVAAGGGASAGPVTLTSACHRAGRHAHRHHRRGLLLRDGVRLRLHQPDDRSRRQRRHDRSAVHADRAGRPGGGVMFAGLHRHPDRWGSGGPPDRPGDDHPGRRPRRRSAGTRYRCRGPRSGSADGQRSQPRLVRARAATTSRSGSPSPLARHRSSSSVPRSTPQRRPPRRTCSERSPRSP
jgi:putative cell wall-binding protein